MASSQYLPALTISFVCTLLLPYLRICFFEEAFVASPKWSCERVTEEKHLPRVRRWPRVLMRVSPSFLKRITEMPMRSLNLPSSFVRIHGSLLSSNVILEGPSRKRWKVRVDGSLETLSVSFGEGFQSFVADHVLQLGDQLCFILPANSHFQVQVYDEDGCQKTSALDATGSRATPSLAPESLKRTTSRTSSLVSRKPAALQIPPVVADSASQTPTSTKPALTLLSENRRLSHPALAAEHHPRENAKKELSDLQLRKGCALRDSLRSPVGDGDSSVPEGKHTSDRGTSVLFNNPYDTRGSADEFRMDLHESVTGFDSDFSDCFVDMEKARAAPDLHDTEPLSPEDLRPCWE